MANPDAVITASEDAQLALLRAITEAISGDATRYSGAVLQLAEAYAWVASPGQPHGA